ncbi:MAG: hypothetical protein ACTSVZ_04410 [Promethearchaeota archaeon]
MRYFPRQTRTKRVIIGYSLLILIIGNISPFITPFSLENELGTGVSPVEPLSADISGNELYAEQIKFNIAGKYNLVRHSSLSNDTNILAGLDLSDPAFNGASFYLTTSNGIESEISPFPTEASNLNYISVSMTQFKFIIYFEGSEIISEIHAQRDRILDIFKNLLKIDLIVQEAFESITEGFYYEFTGFTPNWADYFETTVSNIPKDGYWATFDREKILSEDYMDNYHLSSNLLFLKDFQMLDKINNFTSSEIVIPFDLSPLDSSNSLLNVAFLPSAPTGDGDEESEEELSYIERTKNLCFFSVQYEGNPNSELDPESQTYKFDIFSALTYDGATLGISDKCFNSLDGISLSKIDIGLLFGEMISMSPETFPFDSESLNRLENLLFLVSDDIDFSFLDEYSFKVKWITEDSLSMLTTIPINQHNSSDMVNYLELITDLPAIGGLLGDFGGLTGGLAGDSSEDSSGDLSEGFSGGLGYGIPGSSIAPLEEFTLNYVQSQVEPSLRITKQIQVGNATNILNLNASPEINLTVSNPNPFPVWGKAVNLSIIGFTNDPTQDITLLDLDQSFFELFGYDTSLIINILETLGYTLDDLFHDDNPRFFQLDLNNSGTFDTMYPDLFDLNINRLFPYSPEFTALLIDNSDAFGSIADNPQMWNSTESMYNPENWKLDPDEEFSLIVDSGQAGVNDTYSIYQTFNLSTDEGSHPITAVGLERLNTQYGDTFIQDDDSEWIIDSVSIGETQQIQQYLFFTNTSELLHEGNDTIDLDSFLFDFVFGESDNTTTVQMEIYNHTHSDGPGDGFIDIPTVYDLDNPGVINYTFSNNEFNISQFYSKDLNFSLIIRLTFENDESFSISHDYIQVSLQDRFNNLIFHNQTVVQYCSFYDHNQYYSHSNSLLLSTAKFASLIVENNITRLNSDNLFQCNITISNIGSIDAHNVDLSLIQIGRIPDLHDISHILINNLSTFQSITSNFTLISGILYFNQSILKAGEKIENLTVNIYFPYSMLLPAVNITWVNSPQFNESVNLMFGYSIQDFYSQPLNYEDRNQLNFLHQVQIEYLPFISNGNFLTGDNRSVFLNITNLNGMTIQGLEFYFIENIQGLSLQNESNYFPLQQLEGYSSIILELQYQKENYQGYFLPAELDITCIENNFLQPIFIEPLILGDFNLNISKTLSQTTGIMGNIIEVTITLENTGNIETGNLVINDVDSYSADAFILESGVIIQELSMLEPGSNFQFVYQIKVLNSEGYHTINPVQVQYFFGNKLDILSESMVFKVLEPKILIYSRIIIPAFIGLMSMVIIYKYKSNRSRADFDYQRRENLFFGKDYHESSWYKKNLIEFFTELEEMEEL